MNATVPFDTLAMAHALREEAGFDQRQADGVTRVVAMATGELATRDELAGLRAAMKDDLARMEARLEGKIDVSAAGLRTEISASKAEMVKWFIGTIAAQTGLMLAAMRLMH